MSMSPTGPVGRILPTLSAVGDMSATCRRHAQLSLEHPHRPNIGGDIWWDRGLVSGWTWRCGVVSCAAR